MPRPSNPELPRLLLNAALELLDERQNVDFSMRELAARVGYTVTAVYRCYETRGHLLRTLTVELFGALSRHLDDPAEGDVVDRLTTMGERYLRWAVRHPGRYKLMFQLREEGAMLGPEEQRVARSTLRSFEETLRQGAGATDGEARPAAIALLARVHGLASLALAERLRGTEAEDVISFYARHERKWLERSLKLG